MVRGWLDGPDYSVAYAIADSPLSPKKAASNSITLHDKKIAAGDSILDYARDTSNKIDSEFITCFGRAAAGQVIKLEQKICYKEIIIWTRCTYTPVYEGDVLLGISIVVEDITDLKASES